MTAFVSSARSGARVIYYSQCQNYYIHWLFLLFLFIARSSGNYNVFFFFTRRMKMAYLPMFYAKFQFYAQVKFANLYRNPANIYKIFVREESSLFFFFFESF